LVLVRINGCKFYLLVVIIRATNAVDVLVARGGSAAAEIAVTVVVDADVGVILLKTNAALFEFGTIVISGDVASEIARQGTLLVEVLNISRTARVRASASF